MATVDQIYTLVNSIRKQAFGETGVTVSDTSSLVSLGDYVMNSTDNRDLWWNALIDQIGRTFASVRPYTGAFRSIRKTPMEWGAAIQKISYEIGEAIENDAWNTKDADPMNVEGSITPYSKLFKAINTWEHDQYVPDDQLKKSFTSAEAMDAFVSGLFISLDNALEIEIESTSALAVGTYMAGLLDSSNTNGNTKRNLLNEYNTLTNRGLTINAALMDSGFLKFASQQINLTIKKMRKFSTLYNAEKKQRHTPEDKVSVEMLADFASATTSYLEANTYHNELVKLPNYEEIPYWQGSGEQDTFAEVSEIKIKHGNKQVEQSGIICLVHDVDAIACCDYDVRTLSMYNPKSEKTNYFKKARIGYMADLSENGVVFYLAEV